MGHTELKSQLSIPIGIQHLSNTSGIPVAVAIAKATFMIRQDTLLATENQIPIFPTGRPLAEPGKSSYIYEPESSYFKPNTDIILVGAACPPEGAATSVNVEFSVGAYLKRAVVYGDRWWERGFLGPRLSDPEPFESIPLTYERAFGGWDRSNPNPDKHTLEPRNPVGVGFQREFKSDEDRLPAPNIEDPRNLISSMSSRPKPVGFGFTSPDWHPRASLAGTFDSVWEQTRAPLLPSDFNPLFFNAASEGLVTKGYLSGDESVRLVNCARQPLLEFSLPAVPPPVCRFKIRGQAEQLLSGPLDTVVVNTIENIVTLTWRCHVPLPRGPESLLELHVGSGAV